MLSAALSSGADDERDQGLCLVSLSLHKALPRLSADSVADTNALMHFMRSVSGLGLVYLDMGGNHFSGSVGGGGSMASAIEEAQAKGCMIVL